MRLTEAERFRLLSLLYSERSPLTEEGRALVKRLQAAGAPGQGRDAYAFSLLLQSGEIEGEDAALLCRALGYLHTGGYPLTRLPRSAEDVEDILEGEQTYDDEGNDGRERQPEPLRPGRPASGDDTVSRYKGQSDAASWLAERRDKSRRLRAGGLSALDERQKKALQRAREKESRRRRREGKSKNTGSGRKKLDIAWEKLPLDKWIGTDSAALLLGVHVATVKRRIAARDLPACIEIRETDTRARLKRHEEGYDRATRTEAARLAYTNQKQAQGE